MHDESKIIRILKILQWLSAGSRLTTHDLLRRFDDQISLRTLQRYMHDIIEANIPLRCEKGPANQNIWSLEPWARSFNPVPLGPNEYLAAMVLKANLRIFRETGFQKEIDSLINKLDQIAPDEVFEDLSRFQVFDIYTVGEVDYSGMGHVIDTFFEAIVGKHPCTVTYLARNVVEPKTYQITPVKFLLYKGALYVNAYIHKHENFLRLSIDRIISINAADEVDHLVPEHSTNDLFKRAFGLLPAAETEQVRLLFKHEISPHISHRRWHISQKMSETDKQGLLLEMEVGITPELESWILSWIPYVKILGPKELRENVKQRMEKGLLVN